MTYVFGGDDDFKGSGICLFYYNVHSISEFYSAYRVTNIRCRNRAMDHLGKAMQKLKE